MRNTIDFDQLDQTAVSFDNGSGGFGGDNFATLRDAFAAPNAEDAMVDRNNSFTSPYFDTEMLLEMTQNQKQVDRDPLLIKFCFAILNLSPAFLFLPPAGAG
jgi:hypothetical protein